MSNEQNSIDELFRNGLKDGGITPPPGVWEAVSAGLPAASPGLVTLVVKSVWTWVAVGGIAVGAVTALILSEKNEPLPKAEKSAINNAQKEVSTPNVLPSEKTAQPAVVTPQKTQVKQSLQADNKPQNIANSDNAATVPAVENSANKNQTTRVQQTPEKQVPKLEVVQQSTAEDAPCGINVKVIATKNNLDNSWSFTAGASSVAFHSWSFGDGETGSGNLVQHLYPDLNAEYEVRVLVFRYVGCIDSGRCTVVTRQRHPGLSVPDLFTPNGDGINDELEITTPDVASFNQVVTDRNGKQVFNSNSALVRWNGKCASVECPSGTYRVTITYKTQSGKQAVTFTKNVLLKR
ncbi:MAG: T9SS type B sorting domain-containing protein [Sphingomonadales bacterium]|nr:T9SS type B sorting domain-containing protein [Sphingomonadales bacterium]